MEAHSREHVEPEIAVGLRRIREAKQQHREELGDMLMKSDPYTTPAAATQQAQVEPQQHAWLEQRKSAWLEHERAEWEAGGKQVPWAEWSGEQEWKWAPELPHRDLEWARRLAEQGAEETSRAAGSAAPAGDR